MEREEEDKIILLKHHLSMKSFEWTLYVHWRNKRHQDELLLNLEHLSFFLKNLVIMSCTKYQLKGCMLVRDRDCP